MLNTKKLIFTVLLLLTNTCYADLPFLKHLSGKHNLPKPFGLSVDSFSVKQNYNIGKFQVGPNEFDTVDPSLTSVNSDINYTALRFDAWVFPFLNLFAMHGKVDVNTHVDNRQIMIPSLNNIDLDGDITGMGMTVAFGKSHWFGSLTTTITETNLDGKLESEIDTLTLQPKLGLIFGKTNLWVTALYIDSEESHRGSFDLGIPSMPPTNFDATLVPKEKVNYGIGARFELAKNVELTGEIGFGGIEHQLISLGWRF